MPARSAARHSRSRSPAGSAAASSANAWASGGRLCTWRKKCSWSRWPSGSGSGSTARPDSWSAVYWVPSSTSASGLLRVSARMRSTACAFRAPPVTALSSSRASASGRPSTVIVGSCSNTCCEAGSPTPAMRPTRSAYRRRATNPSTCADSGSSQCASSIMHSSGCASAARESSVSVASPTRNISGGGPASWPKATRSAPRCGGGKSSSSDRHGTSSWCRPPNSMLISDSTPAMPQTRRSGAAVTAYSSSVDLPTPGPPRSTSVPLKPLRTASRTRSIAARSVRRSSSANSSRHRSSTRRGPAQSLRSTGDHRLPISYDPGCQLDEPTSLSSGDFSPGKSRCRVQSSRRLSRQCGGLRAVRDPALRAGPALRTALPGRPAVR